MFDFLQICLRKAKPVCKIPHMFILADVWLLPNMFGKKQTCWYIYTWVLFSTHVWILTHRYGKRHTCVQKATQLYVCKCLAFSTHVWEKPLTCLFPPELWVAGLLATAQPSTWARSIYGRLSRSLFIYAGSSKSLCSRAVELFPFLGDFLLLA